MSADRNCLKCDTAMADNEGTLDGICEWCDPRTDSERALDSVPTDHLIYNVDYWLRLGRWLGELADEIAGRPLSSAERGRFDDAIRAGGVRESIQEMVLAICSVRS